MSFWSALKKQELGIPEPGENSRFSWLLLAMLRTMGQPGLKPSEYLRKCNWKQVWRLIAWRRFLPGLGLLPLASAYYGGRYFFEQVVGAKYHKTEENGRLNQDEYGVFVKLGLAFCELVIHPIYGLACLFLHPSENIWLIFKNGIIKRWWHKINSKGQEPEQDQEESQSQTQKGARFPKLRMTGAMFGLVCFLSLVTFALPIILIATGIAMPAFPIAAAVISALVTGFTGFILGLHFLERGYKNLALTDTAGGRSPKEALCVERLKMVHSDLSGLQEAFNSGKNIDDEDVIDTLYCKDEDMLTDLMQIFIDDGLNEASRLKIYYRLVDYHNVPLSALYFNTGENDPVYSLKELGQLNKTQRFSHNASLWIGRAPSWGLNEISGRLRHESLDEDVDNQDASLASSMNDTKSKRPPIPDKPRRSVDQTGGTKPLPPNIKPRSKQRNKGDGIFRDSDAARRTLEINKLATELSPPLPLLERPVVIDASSSFGSSNSSSS